MRVARLLFPVCLCALPLGIPAARAQTFSTPPTVPTPPAPAVPGPSSTGPTAPVSPPPLPAGGTATAPGAGPSRPQGTTRPPGTAGAAPPPSFVGNRQAADHDVIDFDGDTIRTSGPTDNQITAQGHVVARYQGYTLTADRMDLDMDTEDALFTGNVVLNAPNGEKVEGRRTGTLRLNLRRGTYTVTDAHSTVGPQALNVGVLLPVFIYGGTITGRPGFIEGRDSTFTTCDFVVPHYSFGARQVYIIPGKHLVAKQVTLYRKGHRILTIPYFYAPLDQRLQRQTLFPQVGQTPDEGYFVKFALGYALATGLPGILRLDEMQKKGTGLGFEQNYGSTSRPNRGSGLLTLYRLYDRSSGLENVNGSLNHQQRFGTVTASLFSQFQQNSYYAGSSKSNSLNNQLNLIRSVGNLDLALRTSLTQNSYGLGRSQTLTSSFDGAFRPTAAEQFTTRLDYSRFTSPGFAGATGNDRQQLNTNVDYTQHGRYDFELLGTKYTQIGASTTGSSFFGGLERLPEFRLATDALRESFLRHFLPSTTRVDLSLGDFNEPSSLTRTVRARFGLDLGTTTRDFGRRNELTYGGSFQQGLYGDDAAQYVLNGHTGYRLRIGGKSFLGATYTYLRPYGFTPFQFDTVGSTNVASFNFGYQETPRFGLALSTGYDFNQTRGQFGQPPAPWQSVSAQMLIAPSPIFALRTTAAYDLNRGKLLDLTNTLRSRRGAFALDLASRYDPVQRKFSQINGSLDLPFFRDPREDAGYRLRAIGGYNGYTDKFDYKGLALTRSWHDWEMTLVYQDTPNGLRPGSTFTFNFRLKAFPAYEPFAVGQYGQSLDTGVGQVF